MSLLPLKHESAAGVVSYSHTMVAENDLIRVHQGISGGNNPIFLVDLLDLGVQVLFLFDVVIQAAPLKEDGELPLMQVRDFAIGEVIAMMQKHPTLLVQMIARAKFNARQEVERALMREFSPS